MKNSILSFAISFLLINCTFAIELRTPEEIIEQREQQRPRYILKTEMLDVMVLGMSYGESYVISELDKKILKSADVRRIDLVFTDYPKGQDLKKLNLERVKMLAGLRKSLVSDINVNWNIIRQMGCNNEAEAKTMFHGIIIHYKGEQNEEDRLLELRSVNTFLPEESELGNIKECRKNLRDSSIIKILERNKKWKNIAVTADLTGSMAPYTAQLVLWFKLKTSDQRIKELVFFNDGDMKPDHSKVVGSTGGIYHEKAANYNQVRKLALTTIQNGCGGDGPENDIEALYYTMQNTENIDEYILIADNSAPVKDFSLLHKLDKPVRIILCGTYYGINPQYLEIALKTGGSVHTMESDLEDLIQKKEGEEFTFMREKFRIQNGSVVPVNRSVRR